MLVVHPSHLVDSVRPIEFTIILGALLSLFEVLTPSKTETLLALASGAYSTIHASVAATLSNRGILMTSAWNVGISLVTATNVLAGTPAITAGAGYTIFQTTTIALAAVTWSRFALNG